MSGKTPKWYRNRTYLHFDQPISRDTAAELVSDSKRVAQHSFYPFLKFEISSLKIKKTSSGRVRKKEKTRPIAFAAHRDSHIYAYYSSLLSEAYESWLASNGVGKSVLAFRTLGKSNIEFARDAFAHIKNLGPCVAVAMDFSKFFDTLDHRILKDRWSDLLGVQNLPDDHYAVYKSLTRFSFVEREQLYRVLGISKNRPFQGRRRICSSADFRERVRGGGLIQTHTDAAGIPQGSPMSALLSNIYMMNFDREAEKAAQEFGGAYFRYCDDLLFVVRKQWEQDVVDFVTTKAADLKVTINPDKTEIRRFALKKGRLLADRPLQYLGFLYDGERIYLRSASLARYSDRMHRGVRLAKKARDKRNVALVNRGEEPTNLYKTKIYERYSHLGRRNFVRYSLRAAKVMKSSAIRRQIKPLWGRLKKEIES